MADRNKVSLKRKLVYSGSFGNKSSYPSDYTGTADIGDKIYLDILPGGLEVSAATIVSAGLGTGVTLDLGVEYITGDGSDDLTLFHSAADVAAAGHDEYAGFPVVLEGDAYLVATVAGANSDGSKFGAIVEGIYEGPEH